MKKLVVSLATATMALAALPMHGQLTYEARGAFPLQLAIWYPIQLMPRDYAVTGLKLNCPYGYNEHVVGFDLGVYGAAREMEAIQINVYNDVIERIAGWQIGAINRSGSVYGLQTSLLNFADLDVAGIQIGVVNRAEDVRGLQIGLINTCEMMSGVQLGLINIIAESSFPFFLGVNCRF